MWRYIRRCIESAGVLPHRSARQRSDISIKWSPATIVHMRFAERRSFDYRQCVENRRIPMGGSTNL